MPEDREVGLELMRQSSNAAFASRVLCEDTLEGCEHADHHVLGLGAVAQHALLHYLAEKLELVRLRALRKRLRIHRPYALQPRGQSRGDSCRQSRSKAIAELSEDDASECSGTGSVSPETSSDEAEK